MRGLFCLIFAAFSLLFLAPSCSSSSTLQTYPLGNDSLLPLATSRSWTYLVSPRGSEPTCSGGYHTQTVKSQAVQNGMVTYEMSFICGLEPYSFFSLHGDFVQGLDSDSGHWESVLDQPLIESHRWTAKSTQYIWHKLGTIISGNFTYADCWLRRGTGETASSATFCRGWGLVSAFEEDNSGNGWQAQLVNKSF